MIIGIIFDIYHVIIIHFFHKKYNKVVTKFVAIKTTAKNDLNIKPLVFVFRP